MNAITITRLKAVWETKNPVLGSGQPGFEDETGKLKIGDGTTRWNSLPYQDVVPYTLPSANESSSDGPSGGLSAAELAASPELKAAFGLPGTSLTVAAADTLARLRKNADYVCTGTGDLAVIQEALDALPDSATSSGEVLLLAGNYNDATGGTVSIGSPSSASISPRKVLRFQRGARINVSGRTDRKAVLKVESDLCQVINPNIAGNTARGTGTGIAFGGDVATFGGRWDRIAYLGFVDQPILRNLTTGVEFASIDNVGSTGDCYGIGGHIEQCQTGVRAAGYVNRWFSLGAMYCDINVWVESRRAEAQFDVYGSTLNNWYVQAIRVDGGAGSTFHDTWAEHTALTGTPTEAIHIGLSNAVRASNIRFTGKILLWLRDESYAFRLVGSVGLDVEELQLSTSGNPPSVAIVRNEMSVSSKNNRFRRITFGPSPIPAHTVYSVDGTIPVLGEVFIDRVPGAQGANEYTTRANSQTVTSSSPVVRKTVDQSKASDTTLADDPNLALDLQVATSYTLRGLLIFDAGQTGDLKAAMTVPAGATLQWVGLGAASSHTSAVGVSSVTTQQATSGFVLAWGGAAAGTSVGVIVQGIITVGATPGRLQLRWAQNAADVTPTILKAGSWLRLEPIV